jgi:hypothetical protein
MNEPHSFIATRYGDMRSDLFDVSSEHVSYAVLSAVMCVRQLILTSRTNCRVVIPQNDTGKSTAMCAIQERMFLI